MATAYDQVSYPAHVHPQAHPDRLATMGRLFGLPAADVERGRVLELGCGDGGNLIPTAYSLPGARFLGIDLAESAVARAAAAARELGLDNVEVRAMDIRDFPTDAGRFDCIVAHGVYSWVPADVRERIFAICRDHLTERGVAYISYNAYPGARLREIAREVMRFGLTDGGAADGAPMEVVARSRALLRTIASAAAASGEGYAAVLAGEVKRVEAVVDAVLFHDDLGETNAPIYFHDFAARAAQNGLQYLSDAEYEEATDRPVRAGLAERLDELVPDGDMIRREQFADFIRGRAFRRSLLCRAGVPLTRPVSPHALRGLYVSSSARAEPEGDPATRDGVVRFRTPKGIAFSTNHALAKAALARLDEAWPSPVPFDELLGLAGEPDRERAVAELGEFLLTAAAAGAVGFHSRAPRLTTRSGQRPRASSLARWQARRGPMVTTIMGAIVNLEGALARELLVLLDGARDRAALVEELAAAARGRAHQPRRRNGNAHLPSEGAFALSRQPRRQAGSARAARLDRRWVGRRARSQACCASTSASTPCMRPSGGAFGVALIVLHRLDRGQAAPPAPVATADGERTAPHSRALVGFHMVAFGVMYFAVNQAVIPGLVPEWFAGQRGVGAAVIFAGAALMVWTRVYFRSWRFRAKLDQGHQLAVGGPFRFLRHPIHGVDPVSASGHGGGSPPRCSGWRSSSCSWVATCAVAPRRGSSRTFSAIPIDRTRSARSASSPESIERITPLMGDDRTVRGIVNRRYLSRSKVREVRLEPSARGLRSRPARCLTRGCGGFTRGRQPWSSLGVTTVLRQTARFLRTPVATPRRPASSTRRAPWMRGVGWPFRPHRLRPERLLRRRDDWWVADVSPAGRHGLYYARDRRCGVHILLGCRSLDALSAGFDRRRRKDGRERRLWIGHADVIGLGR